MLYLAFALALLIAFLIVAGWRESQYIIQRRQPDEPDSPARYGLPFEEVEFKSRDGITLRGWFIPAHQAKGTVIFCHGHAGSMDPDLKYAPWFHSSGFNVLMFDFRGHGRSEGDKISMGYFERFDLLGAVDYLRGRGIDNIGVLGFSMGGAVAITTAAMEPSIKAVACDGAFAHLLEVLVRGIGVVNPALRPIGFIAGPLALLFASLRLGAWLPSADPIRWVAKISPRPILIIHGERDVFISTQAIKALYQAAGEPKELWIVPNAGHRNADELYPHEWKERVIGFFEKWLGGSG